MVSFERVCAVTYRRDGGREKKKKKHPRRRLFKWNVCMQLYQSYLWCHQNRGGRRKRKRWKKKQVMESRKHWRKITIDKCNTFGKLLFLMLRLGARAGLIDARWRGSVQFLLRVYFMIGGCDTERYVATHLVTWRLFYSPTRNYVVSIKEKKKDRSHTHTQTLKKIEWQSNKEI